MKIFNFLKRTNRKLFRRIVKQNLGASPKLDKAISLIVDCDSEEWSIILNNSSFDQDGVVLNLDPIEDSVFMADEIPGWIIL